MHTPIRRTRFAPVLHFLEYFWNIFGIFQRKIAAQGGYLGNHGASNQDRTDDPRFTRAVLYQLSYAGVQKRANNYTGKPCIIQAEILKKPENTTNKALKIICILLRCLLNALMRSSVSSSWVCCKRQSQHIHFKCSGHNDLESCRNANI